MHIFISYAKKDTSNLAFRLQAILNNISPDVTTWIDRNLEGGESWSAGIETEIKRCDLFVVLLSPDVNRQTTPRSFVIKEINFAQSFNKPVIPVKAQETYLPVQIADLQFVDLTKGEVTGIQNLIELIRKHLMQLPMPLDPQVPTTAGYRDDQERPETLQPPTHKQFPWTLIVLAAILLLVIGFVLRAQSLAVLATATTNTPTSQAAVAVTTLSPTPIDTPIPTVTTTAIAIILPIDTPTPSLIQIASTPVTANNKWQTIGQELDGIPMVIVPVGCFMLGSDQGDTFEKPPVKKCFTKPFWIGKTEVTNKQYGTAGRWGYRTDDRPRDNLKWLDTERFCERHGGRLPTETEWEFAARGPDDRQYPWTGGFSSANVVYAGNADQSITVGSKPGGASWVGALDMSGNLWEWTLSVYEAYTSDITQVIDDTTDTTSFRVLRGGSWTNDVMSMSLWLRRRQYASDYSYLDIGDIGFRCMRPFTQ